MNQPIQLSTESEFAIASSDPNATLAVTGLPVGANVTVYNAAGTLLLSGVADGSGIVSTRTTRRLCLDCKYYDPTTQAYLRCAVHPEGPPTNDHCPDQEPRP